MSKGNKNIGIAGKNTQFSSENQPPNRGRKKGKTISDWIRKLGESKKISFELHVTDANGKQTKKSGKVESLTTLNELIAANLISKAVNGDYRAVEIVLDRAEGKPQSSIDISSLGESVVTNTVTAQELALLRKEMNEMGKSE